jgi:hypothetical protein
MKTNMTTKLSFFIGFCIIGLFANAQIGLENLIVEKYYVSDANDADASVGILPVGSVTYRVYVDMLPGYKFQDAYGNENHSLKIITTTSFFNNEDRGGIIPTFTKAQAKNNTVMLDSWLTAGAACSGNFGIPKSEDNSVETVINADGILLNEDPTAGIPLATQDGFIAGTPGTCAIIGMDSEASIFDATSQAGNSFIISDGAWYCLDGAIGPNDNNKVLIAQITTDGLLHLELNIQIGTPDGDFEDYVPKDPVLYNGKMEIQKDFLDWSSWLVNTVSPNENKKPVISVYPNPVHDVFSLNISNLLNSNSNNFYAIYDITGKFILSKKIENVTGNYYEKIDMRQFANGIYLMDISLNGVKTNSKIIKSE